MGIRLSSFLSGFLLLGMPLAHASTEISVGASFEDVNFIQERENHPINDQETLEVDGKLTYDNEKNFKTVVHPWFKFDFLDTSRNRYIPNETYLMAYSQHMEISGGIQTWAFGVSQSYNPTDVLNRRDLESNFFDPEKLGEVFVMGKYIAEPTAHIDNFTISAFVFPLFQKTPFPELDTRFAIEGTTNFIPYTLTDNQDTMGAFNSIGMAINLEASLKNIDLGLLLYHGPDHMPASQLILDGQGALRLRPFYYIVDMIGFNFSASVGNFLLHFESAGKITSINDPKEHDIAFEDGNAVPKSYGQFVPGVDYTFHNFAGDGDFTVTMEYLLDTQRDHSITDFRPFQNDLFFGFKYDFLNKLQSSLTFGVIKDMTNEEALVSMDVTTKVYRELKLSLGGIFVHQDSNLDSTPISFFDNNSFVRASLSYEWGTTLGKK